METPTDLPDHARIGEPIDLTLASDALTAAVTGPMFTPDLRPMTVRAWLEALVDETCSGEFPFWQNSGDNEATLDRYVDDFATMMNAAIHNAKTHAVRAGMLVIDTGLSGEQLGCVVFDGSEVGRTVADRLRTVATEAIITAIADNPWFGS